MTSVPHAHYEALIKHELHEFCKSCVTPQILMVAYSGGVDSHVLLHTLHKVMHAYPHLTLQAHHVHHGLQDAADCFVKHCLQVCQTLAVPLTISNLNIELAPGDSIEAKARTARYHALTDHVADNVIILTAHHQQDQAESFLLQAMRGAGPTGLSAMPRLGQWNNIPIARLLLKVPQQAILAYAAHYNLQFIEDPTNQDLCFMRNALRQQVMPALQRLNAGVLTGLTRAAELCADANEVLTAYIERDFHICFDPNRRTLNISALLLRSVKQRALIMRYWLQQQNIPMPSKIKLQHIDQDVLLAREDAQPALKFAGYCVTRFRGDLYVMSAEAYQQRGEDLLWPALELTSMFVPGLKRTLGYHRQVGAGISAHYLFAAKIIEICFGGSTRKIQLPGETFHRSLKYCWQHWGVPFWQRQQIPLIILDGKLAAVVGYSVAENFAAQADQLGYTFAWL